MKTQTKHLIYCLLLILLILGYTIVYLPFAEQFHYTQRTIKGNITGYELVEDQLIVTIDAGTQQYQCKITLNTTYDMQCHIIFDKRLTEVPIYIVTESYRPVDMDRDSDAIFAAKNVGLIYDSDWDALIRAGMISQEELEQYRSIWR